MPPNTKKEIFHIIGRDYLEQVILELNASGQSNYLTYSDDRFQEYILNKLTHEDLTVIWRNRALSNPPKKAANQISDETARQMVERYVSVEDIDKYLTEFRLGDSVCDLVKFPSDYYHITAVEFKSKRDDFRRLQKQCHNYSQWANRIIVVVSPEHESTALSEAPDWVGVEVLTDSGARTARTPDEFDHSEEEILDLMTSNQLSCVLEHTDMSSSGVKSKLIQRAKKSLDTISKPALREALLVR